MRILITIATIFILFGCNKKSFYDLDDMPNEGIILRKWHIIGPFPSEGVEKFLDVDNLLQYKLNENTVTLNDLVNIRVGEQQKNFISEVVTSSNHKIDFNKIFGYSESTTIAGNVYCACILQSDRERKLKLNFSSDDGAKIWLNHRLIFNYDRIGAIKYYDNYIDLDLKQGDNLLLIKVNNVRLGWEMFTAVEEETEERIRRYKRTFALEFGNYYLQRSTINNDSITLNEGLPVENYTFILKTRDNKVLLQDSTDNLKKRAWSISHLKDGLYSSTLYARGDTFSESFYKGNIIIAIQKLLDKVKLYRLDDDAKRNIDALAYRYRHLLKPGNMGKNAEEKRDWDKKMIFLYSSLEHYYNNLKNGIAPETQQKGGILRTYISKIDSGLQYYQLFVPKNYTKEEPLPIIVELPKFMNRHPSPLETYRFANIRLFELFEDLADKYKVFILDPGCRTIDKANWNTIDEADFWEALDAVRQKYNIDTTRIYLRGACLSCRSALKLAVKYPSKFAAVALVAPELKLIDIDNIYLQQNEPLNYLSNISNIPILNIHSKLDPHTPIETSEELIREAQKAGLKHFTYRKLSMEFKTYYSEEYLDDIFDFLVKHRLNPSPSEISFKTSSPKYSQSFWINLDKIVSGKNVSICAKINNNTLTINKENVESYTIDLNTLPFTKNKPFVIYDNGEKVFDRIISKEQSINIGSIENGLHKNSNITGPFADIFSTPFILVLGTTGAEKEKNSIRAIADTINSYWKLRYYGGCRIKLDKDVSERDLGDHSILLLGTPKSNSIYDRIEKKLPAKINSNSIEINGRKIEGSDLGFYFIYPSPYNSARYVAVIGYNNPSFISLGHEKDGKSTYFTDPSAYGWYDYKIWDAKTSEDILAGYFDFYWR